jgi:hypothetical protein
MDLRVGACVDVIDAPLDAPRHDLVPVLLRSPGCEAFALSHPSPLNSPGHHLVDALPMTAQANGRHHPAGFAAAAVLHVRIVIEDAAGIEFLGIPDADDVGQSDAGGQRRGAGCRVTNKLATSQTRCGHLGHPFPELRGRWETTHMAVRRRPSNPDTTGETTRRLNALFLHHRGSMSRSLDGFGPLRPSSLQSYVTSDSANG